MDRRKRTARTVALMSLFSMTDIQQNVSVASFDGDGSDLISLIVGIDPVQDLNGYDNPWPAGGGKNKFNVDAIVQNSSITVSNGVISVDGQSVTAGKKFGQLANVKVGETYLLTAKTTGKGNYIYLVSSGNSWYFGTQRTITEMDLNSDVRFYSGEVGTTAQISNMMVRLASVTDATFSPYSNICPISGWTGANIHVSPTTDAADGTTYPIPLGTTVYGATIDVVNGKVYARPYYPSYNGETLVGPWISSMDKYEEGATPTTGAQVVDMGGTVTEISLTPTQVTTLIGTNNIWADTGEIKYIEYNV